MRSGYSFKQITRRQWDIQFETINLDSYFTLYKKVNSKRIIDLTVKRATPTKLIEENMGPNLRDLGLGNDFLDMASKA